MFQVLIDYIAVRARIICNDDETIELLINLTPEELERILLFGSELEELEPEYWL
ncbi:hypothetical protein [Polycladidibacter hongkongensis]|uniref:hypothetical protein n=1 Tax=Polycladidibacter hongkongensis TaxID=1647556 RepID=UPI000ADAE630|nr:hypothetical protein [Pseudovibrio hongkongensis]